MSPRNRYQSAPATTKGNWSESGDLLKTTSKSAGIQAGIAAPPTNGIHSWIMEAAWQCRKAGMHAGSAVAALESYEGTLRRRYQRREIEDAVQRVYATNIDCRPNYQKPPALPNWNQRETLRLHREIKATADSLRAISPMEDPETITPEGIIHRLFPDPETLLCIGRSNRKFKTATLAEFDDLRDHQLIVPAPMIARWGRTQDGKPSQHTKEATGPRAYIVCDFDDPPPEQHPSIIMQLMKFRGAVLVLSSGGKSLHAWFPTTPRNGNDRIFWRTCIALGADPALYRNPSQFVRLPNATRDNGKLQEVVYFNPNQITQ